MNTQYRQFELLKTEMEQEAVSILNFWIEKTIDHEQGGFYGQITGKNELKPHADKGIILNARILWAFSAAYRVLKNSEYLSIANRAYEYLISHFMDTKFGGVYWMLDYKGNPISTKKQIYAQAFTVYALTEYYRVTANDAALNKAIEIFHLIEKHSYDPNLSGYFEAFSQNWQLLDDLRLSDKDANEAKTMNTHLHVLEAYTNLYRVWQSPLLSEQLYNLILIFLERIINHERASLNLFFDENWNQKSHETSFGHDIEATWLLYEAAEVLGNKQLIEQVKLAVQTISAKVLAFGTDADGGIMNESKNDIVFDTDKHWWQQAEAVVGFLNTWEITGEPTYFNAAVNTWGFIKNYLIDKENGEWHWRVSKDHVINFEEDKVGPWKCPYHNSRACFEIIERFERYEKAISI